MGISLIFFFEEKKYIVNWFYFEYFIQQSMVITEIPRTYLQLIKLVKDLKWINEVDTSVEIFGT